MHDQSIGPIQFFEYEAAIIRDILINEGYSVPIFQIKKSNQYCGLTKTITEDLENHVRIYMDNSIDSEVELSREYLEHPYDCRPYYDPVFEIFQKYEVPYRITGEIPRDPTEVYVPKVKTRWKPLVLIGGIFIIGIGLAWVGSKK